MYFSSSCRVHLKNNNKRIRDSRFGKIFLSNHGLFFQVTLYIKLKIHWNLMASSWYLCSLTNLMKAK